MFQWLTLLKTTTLKFEMKCKECTNITIKWQFWCRLRGSTIQIQTRMMNILMYSWSTTSIFQLISFMITILFNIACYYIGKVCGIVAFSLFYNGCGHMGVLLNLRAKSHGILLVNTHIWKVIVQCFEVFLALAVAKGLMMG